MKYQRFHHQVAKIYGFEILNMWQRNWVFTTNSNFPFCNSFFFFLQRASRIWKESSSVSYFKVFVLLEMNEGVSWRNATPLWRIQSVSWTLGNSGLPSVYVTRDLAYMFSAILDPPPSCRTKYSRISRVFIFPGFSISTFMILKRK